MPTKVKICGLKSPEVMAAALDAGADFVGLVLFAKSPRNVSIDEAAALADQARGRARVVVLTVDPDDALLDRIASEIRPDFIQLQGRETVERVISVRRRTGCAIMKAVAVATPADVAAALPFYRPGEAADILLFDAKPPPDAVLPGGNGLTFDWRILAAAKEKVTFALAGGLTPVNVADAIRLAAPAIVDVSSGVERAPGIKDPALIRAFIDAARAAATVA